MQRCARAHTVVGSAVSHHYEAPLFELVNQVAKFFPCLVVQPFNDGFPWNHQPLTQVQDKMHVLTHHLKQPYLPSSVFCDPNSKLSKRYGWRRTHIYKLLMWVRVLQEGFNLISLDLDWRVKSDPLPKFLAAHTIIPVNNKENKNAQISDNPADFVYVLHDGLQRRSLNIGNVFIRSNARTIEFAKLVYNRSHAAQDQRIVNEELNYGIHGVTCCLANQLKGHNQSLHDTTHCGMGYEYFYKSGKTHALKTFIANANDTVHEKVCTTDAQQLVAKDPPKNSKFGWGGGKGIPSLTARKWKKQGYNEKGIRAFVSYGRCSHPKNLCACVY